MLLRQQSHYCSSYVYFINSYVFLAPLLLLELLSYWHTSNGHSSVPIWGSACVSAIPQRHLFLSLSLFSSLHFRNWVEWGDADWPKLITWLFSCPAPTVKLKMEPNCPSVKQKWLNKWSASVQMPECSVSRSIQTLNQNVTVDQY